MAQAETVVAPSLYIHVPFCRSRCSYCDFHSSLLPNYRTCVVKDRDSNFQAGKIESWFKAIEMHLGALQQNSAWIPYSTVYIGGGTPSALPVGVLKDLLRMVERSWIGRNARGSKAARASTPELSEAEWTIECNPDDLSGSMLDSFKTCGVNRISLGVQSLEDTVRQSVGRRGHASEILSILGKLIPQWKRAWSTDFMYGLPGQSVGGLARDIRRIVELGAGHISLYQLTLEEGTPLALQVRGGMVRLPDPDLAADQYSAAAELLTSAGFLRYEVSNWALPGQECRHNLHYWGLDNWDALGPSGVSNRLEGASFVRGQNPADNEVYASDPLGSVELTRVDGKDAMFEFLMMALRTREGFSLQGFSDIFACDPVLVFGDLPATFPTLISHKAGWWQPSDQGLDMLNRVLVAALEFADTAVIKF